jgi:RNA polymerase sigma-70 factor (sigma-E family)
MRQHGRDGADRPDDADFREFMAARAVGIRRTDFLMCGDWHLAEDLAQTAFVRVYAAWPRVCRMAAPDAYLRTTLVHALVDERRRAWRRERPTPTVPDLAEPEADHDDPQPLLTALAHVPPRQRACLVLRFFDDLSVDEVAEVLACRPGTVKSQTSRGLDTLRRVLLELSPELVQRLDRSLLGSGQKTETGR